LTGNSAISLSLSCFQFVDEALDLLFSGAEICRSQQIVLLWVWLIRAAVPPCAFFRVIFQYGRLTLATVPVASDILLHANGFGCARTRSAKWTGSSTAPCRVRSRSAGAPAEVVPVSVKLVTYR
jgi:hypothetical protein